MMYSKVVIRPRILGLLRAILFTTKVTSNAMVTPLGTLE